jgi:hypothetical protein
VSVALVIQRTKCMRNIVMSFVACLALPHFFTLSRKRHNVRKTVVEHQMCVLTFSTISVSNISHSKKNSARYHKCTYIGLDVKHRCSCDVWMGLEIYRQIFEKKNPPVSNLTKIFPVGAELFHADGRTYIHDEVNRRRRSFADAPTNQYNPRQGPHHCTLCWDQCEGMYKYPHFLNRRYEPSRKCNALSWLPVRYELNWCTLFEISCSFLKVKESHTLTWNLWQETKVELQC